MYHSKLSKPKVSDVKHWDIVMELSNSIANVYTADIDDFFFKVTGKGVKTKYFYGETAWQDSQRYASDAYFKDLIERDPWATVKEKN